MTKSTAEPGTSALDFSLQTEQGITWRLSDQRGSVVALLFYPKDLS
jgi:peroxiredoxin